MAEDINQLPQLDALDEQQNVPNEAEIEQPNPMEDLTSLEPAVVQEPASFENQLQTEQAIADAEAIRAQDAMQQRLTGKEQTPLYKEQRDIEDDIRLKAQVEKEGVEAKVETDQVLADLQSEIDKMQAQVDFAQQNGRPSTALVAKIKELEAEKLSLTATADPVDPAALDQEALNPAAQQAPIAEQPSISKVAQLANEIKTENTVAAAEQLALEDEVEEQRALVDKSMQTLRDEDLSLEAIDNDRFWSNKNVFQKIGLGIAMMLGGKQTISIVENAIEKDIASQKLSNQQTLAKRQEAYKRVNLEISRLSSLTTDQDRIEKLKLAKAQIRAKEKEVFRKRQAEAVKKANSVALGAKLSSDKGVSREEFFGLDKELKKTGVTFKDNRVRFASSAEAAKKVSEAIADANSAMNDFKELQEIGKGFLGGAIPLSVAQAKGKLYQQSAIGKLRLELFGPGVLTDIEQKIARSIIGNPAKITNLTHLEVAKLDAITAKLRHSVAQKIRLSGMKLPPSENEINIAKLMKIDAQNRNVDLKNVKIGSRGWQALKKRAYKALSKDDKWVQESEF